MDAVKSIAIELMFQHTAARRRLARADADVYIWDNVSTHSRPKAAGSTLRSHLKPLSSFNTQPPEGGWPAPPTRCTITNGFNTQPPEGGWVLK